MKIPKETVCEKDKSSVSVSLMNIRHCNSHMHEHEIELVYCIAGQLNIISAHMHIALNEGELVLLDRTDIHFMYSDEDNIILTVHIDLRKTGYDYDKIKFTFLGCATQICKPFQQESMQKVIDLIFFAAYRKFQPESTWDSVKSSLCDSLYKVLIEDFNWFSIEDLTSKENLKYRERLEGILQYVQLHFEEKTTISQLAKKYYINENYLSQFLKRTGFKSFSSLVQYIRCYNAEYMLLNTDMSVRQISERCGFSSEKYFYKYFKDIWNNTPYQHKKRHEKFCTKPNNVQNYDDNYSFEIIEKHMALIQAQRIADKLSL